MDQPTPKVTRADVVRVVRREFPTAAFPEILGVLDSYNWPGSDYGRARVQLAALKLAGGSRERLQAEIENAKRDYRDTLAGAEFPHYMRLRFDPGEEAERRAIEADWEQYQEWFTK